MKEVITPALNHKLLWGHIKNISNERVYITLGVMRNAHQISVVKTQGRDYVGDRRRGETTILKWILKQYVVKMLTASN
jgi:hypothetical protein